MRCFPFDTHSEPLEEDETPFASIPEERPALPLSLERMATTFDALLSLSDVVSFEDFDDDARNALAAYLGKPVDSTWDVTLSQIGGVPLAYQSLREIPCPNPKCPASRLTHPYGEFQRPYLMKDLALVHHDDDPDLDGVCFQLLYSICGLCFSIRGEYRCT